MLPGLQTAAAAAWLPTAATACTSRPEAVACTSDIHKLTVLLQVDMPKTADRKLLRVVNYLVQLAAGEGSAGTVVPFSTLSGNLCTGFGSESCRKRLVLPASASAWLLLLGMPSIIHTVYWPWICNSSDFSSSCSAAEHISAYACT
jgi:hypothetical protein